MADIEITVEGGTSKRLLTAGKYCDRNIKVTATGGGGEPEPPDDGKTRLYITVPANSMPDRPPPRNEVPLYIQQSVDNGVTIDWGDGSDPETLPGTGNVNNTHTYQQAGDYVISLDPADGCDLGFGDAESTGIIGIDYPYTSYINRLYIGKGVPNIGFGAFAGLGISNIFIANGVSSIGDFAFSANKCLTSIIIPDSVLSIGQRSFDTCDRILYLHIGDGLTSIGGEAFSACASLSSITIPGSVTSIASAAFLGCLGMKEYHFLSKTPPALENSDVFKQIASDCVIYVPVGSLEAYQTAANWSTYADQMREEGA